MARIAMAVTGLGAAVALTACGGGDGFTDGSADEIVKTAKADMADLKAVKVSGSVTSDGQKIDIDLQASSDGDCTGTIGIAGGTTELLGVGGSTWMRPDEAFWRATAGSSADQVISLVGDKWVVTSGLKSGERVIIEGLLKARPGLPVAPEPFSPKAETGQTAAKAPNKG